MKRTVDEQVEAALRQAMREQTGKVLWVDVTRKVMHELMAGKFAEEPLPKILSPSFSCGKASTHSNLGGEYRVEWQEPMLSGWQITGPTRSTLREAIEAWNAGMRGEPGAQP